MIIHVSFLFSLPVIHVSMVVYTSLFIITNKGQVSRVKQMIFFFLSLIHYLVSKKI
jgi:hypothetical protein